MAKFLSGTITGASGSIGGVTFSHNRGGLYMKAKRVPVNPNSTKQQNVRANLSTVSRQWSLLTSAQQTAWADWAALNPVINTLGSSIILSGQGAYVQLNARIALYGGTVSTTPPAGVGPAQLTTVTAAMVSPSALSVTYTATPLATGVKLFVRQTLPGTKGRNGNINQSRVAGVSAAAAASPAAITTPYTSVAAQQFNVYVAVMDASGRLSPFVKQTVVAT